MRLQRQFMKTTAVRFLAGIVALLVLDRVCLPARAQDTGSTGDGLPFDNRQPTMAVNFIICTNGVYPSSSTGFGAVNLQQAFTGEIRAISFGSPIPPGFALCQGQLVSVTSNPTLFSILGYQYGSLGTTTFQLPNLSGTTPIGAGQGAGLPDYSLGETVGVESEALTINNLPAHTHSTPDGTTGSMGYGAAFNNMQPSLAINFDICTNGQIMMFAGNYTPIGWVPCDGTLYSISAQRTLYNIVGTNYGGDGITTFAVPDLRGRAPIGYGQTFPFSTYVEGEALGSATQALTVKQIPSHVHTLPAGGSTGSTGGFDPFDNRQPVLGLGWYICLYGSYPTAGNTFPMIGELRLYAGTTSLESGFPVLGFAQAMGGTLTSVDDAALFDLIGTTYGSAGTGTFDLPNLSSYLVVGTGQGFETSDYRLGQSVGSESVTLTTSQLPAHVHALPGIIQVQTSSGTILTNGATVSCPNVPDGSFSLDSLVITNIGGMNLELSNITFSGSDPGDFSLTPSITNTSLPAESTLPVNLAFAPSAVATRTAELSIINADVTNNPFVLYLTGNGIPVLAGASLANGSFTFSFTGDPAGQFTVLSATNLSLPLSNWTVIGTATNTSGSNFTFGVALTTNLSQQFYTVRSP